MTETKKRRKHVPINHRLGYFVTLIILLLFAAFLAATGELGNKVVLGERQTLDASFEWQTERYDTSFYAALEKSDYTVEGEEGYVLHAQLLKNPEPSDKYVIISHGITDNRMGSLKYARVYLDLGYNCVIYDLRGHGENAKTITTYGIREGADLAKIIEDTRSRYPGLTQLGLHGESLGAATTISCLKYHPDVDFAVADCGFSDLENVLRGIIKAANAPSFVFELQDYGISHKYKVSLKDMRPIDALDDNTVPVMFIHGEDDTLITPDNSRRMYDRTKGVREIHIVPGAEHAQSVLKDYDAYEGYVKAFIESLQ